MSVRAFSERKAIQAEFSVSFHRCVWVFSMSLGLVLGCGGGRESAPPPPPVPAPAPPGRVSLCLVNDGHLAGFEELRLNLVGLDLRRRGGDWVPLPLTSQPVAVLELEAGAALPLVAGAEVPAGTYVEARFHLAPGHSVKLREGGLVRDLAGPGLITATGLQLHVASGATVDAAFTFPAARAVREAPPASGTFTLLPFHGAALDRGLCGAVRGRLTWPDGRPAAGITVTAQRPGSHPGVMHVLRTATSRPDGAYELDLLPPGGAVRVVVAPGEGRGLQASRPLAPQPPAVCDLALTPPAGPPGSVEVPGFPGFHPAFQVHEAVLPQAPGPQAEAVVVAVVPAEQAGPLTFRGVPPGAYSLRFHQAGWAADPNRGERSERWSEPIEVQARAGEAVTVWLPPTGRQPAKGAGSGQPPSKPFPPIAPKPLLPEPKPGGRPADPVPPRV